MADLELLDTTGDPFCDQVVQGVVGVFEVAFPGRLLGCYLRGSRASGTSVAGSDLDLFLLFKDRFVDAGERARALSAHCARLTPVLLEIVLSGERGLFQPEALSAALDLKVGTRLLYGEDVRPRLPDFDADAYTRSVVHTPYFSYAFPSQRGERLEYPLEHLDPDGPFYGFDQWPVPGPDGVDVPSTKLLVATVGWSATAIVALRAGVYVRDKAESARLYEERVGDEWAELVTQVHELCRNQWHYLVPPDAEERQVLRELCGRALDFQNHFLRLYRDYQVGELASGDIGRGRACCQAAWADCLPRPGRDGDEVSGELGWLRPARPRMPSRTQNSSEVKVLELQPQNVTPAAQQTTANVRRSLNHPPTATTPIR